MPPEDRELSYLWDMRRAAQEIISFMNNVRFAEFEKNKLLRSAVERQLLIIGEAANHISPQFRSKHPQIAWPDLIALRNILAHEYGEVLTGRVWLAATKSAPELLEALKGLLPD
jgi:uncharacterized protein with HEPN domain